MSDQKNSESLNEIESTLFKCIHNESLSGIAVQRQVSFETNFLNIMKFYGSQNSLNLIRLNQNEYVRLHQYNNSKYIYKCDASGTNKSHLHFLLE